MADICIETSTCKQLIITDNYDWGSIIPIEDVTRTVITVKYVPYTGTSTTITAVDENEYISTVTINAEDFVDSWTKILDGYYQINIHFYIDGDDILTYSEVFNKCNQDCTIDNLIADYVADDECDSCNKKMEQDILNIALKSELLCYAITCSNKSKVWEYYNYIANLLLENNCKSC